MSRLVINGSHKISGEISVLGAKNCALKLLAASVLTSEECHFTNVPEIEDVKVMLAILQDLGAKVKKIDRGEYLIECSNITKIELNPKLSAKLRSSVMFLAPLLTRFGEVKFPHPGGCILGKRPIDMFLDGFKALGAEVIENENNYHLKASRLVGGKFVFPWVSHTVTESMIMAAVLAKGETTIINAAREPEVVALSDFLSKCGAQIFGSGSSEIRIKGVDKLRGHDFAIIPDRIETGTFAILGALIGKGLRVTNCNPGHLEVFWQMLKKAGVKIDIGNNDVYIQPSANLQACEVRTSEYPGFATDLQAPFLVLMTQAKGLSLIHETIYEGRLFYTDKLNKMGAHIIMCDPHRAVVNGPTKLFGTRMESPDLRAGIALVLAALVAEGKSEIDNVYQIDRGYENIAGRLSALGADIERVD